MPPIETEQNAGEPASNMSSLVQSENNPSSGGFCPAFGFRGCSARRLASSASEIIHTQPRRFSTAVNDLGANAVAQQNCSSQSNDGHRITAGLAGPIIEQQRRPRRVLAFSARHLKHARSVKIDNWIDKLCHKQTSGHHRTARFVRSPNSLSPPKF